MLQERDRKWEEALRYPGASGPRKGTEPGRTLSLGTSSWKGTVFQAERSSEGRVGDTAAHSASVSPCVRGSCYAGLRSQGLRSQLCHCHAFDLGLVPLPQPVCHLCKLNAANRGTGRACELLRHYLINSHHCVLLHLYHPCPTRRKWDTEMLSNTHDVT